MDVVTKDFRTPKGTFQWPRLNTPEVPPYDGYDGPPIFSCTLRLKLDAPGVREMLDMLDDLFDQNLADTKENITKAKSRKALKPADKSWEYELDEETDEETGYVLLKTKLPSVVTRKRDGKEFPMFLPIFDAKGHKTDVQVGSGTVGKLGLEARGWYMPATNLAGVKLTLRAAQVIELHSFGGKSAEDFGFEEEDGWESPATKAGFTSEESEGGCAPDDTDDQVPF